MSLQGNFPEQISFSQAIDNAILVGGLDEMGKEPDRYLLAVYMKEQLKRFDVPHLQHLAVHTTEIKSGKIKKPDNFVRTVEVRVGDECLIPGQNAIPTLGQHPDRNSRFTGGVTMYEQQNVWEIQPWRNLQGQSFRALYIAAGCGEDGSILFEADFLEPVRTGVIAKMLRGKSYTNPNSPWYNMANQEDTRAERQARRINSKRMYEALTSESGRQALADVMNIYRIPGDYFEKVREAGWTYRNLWAYGGWNHLYEYFNRHLY